METPGESPDLIPPIFGIFKSVSINGVHNWTNHTVGKFLDPRQNWLQPEEFNKGKQLIKRKGGCKQFAPLIKWLTWSLTPVVFGIIGIYLSASKQVYRKQFQRWANQKGMFKKSGIHVHSWPYKPDVNMQTFANFYHCVLILYDQE